MKTIKYACFFSSLGFILGEVHSHDRIPQKIGEKTLVNSNYEHTMGLERQFIHGRGINIKIIVYVAEKISSESFSNAVHILAEMHPFLHSRVILQSDGNGILTTDKGTYPKVVFYSRNRSLSPEAAINIEDQLASHWTTDPTSRFILLENSVGGSIIIAYLHHAIADGRATAFVMKHLLEILADPEITRPMLRPVSLTAAAPPEVQISGVLKKMVGWINRKWAKEKVVFTEDEFIQNSIQFYQRGPDVYLTRQLNEESTVKLRQLAKEKGISINAILLTAAFLVKIKLPKMRHLPNTIGFAVDVRQYLTQASGESCSLLASAISVKPKFHTGIDFWMLASDIHTKSELALKSPKKLFRRLMMTSIMDPTFSDALFMAQQGGWSGTPFIQKLLKKSQKKKLPVCLVITNLGGLQLPLKLNGPNPITVQDAYFFPPLNMKEILELGIASLAGKLTIVIPARRPEYDPQECQVILNRIFDQLHAILKC